MEMKRGLLSEPSSLIDPKFWTLRSNGESSPAQVRIIRFAQRQLEYTGLNIQTNIGPYGREEGYLGESVPGRNIAAAPPGSGTFEIGAVIENSATVERSGGVTGGREQAEDRSRDSDGGGILELLRGLFGGGGRSGSDRAGGSDDTGSSGAGGSGSGGSDDSGGTNGSQTGSRSGSGEVLGWEYTEEGWKEIRG